MIAQYAHIKGFKEFHNILKNNTSLYGHSRSRFLGKLEGVEFRVNSHVGNNVSIEELNDEFDAIAFCGGSEHPRDFRVEVRE